MKLSSAQLLPWTPLSGRLLITVETMIFGGLVAVVAADAGSAVYARLLDEIKDRDHIVNVRSVEFFYFEPDRTNS